MANLSNEKRTEIAINMVILDAIEKGHTNTQELISYMKSKVFDEAVKNYIKIININLKQIKYIF